MAYETKNNTFSLFVNDKKGNDKAPDYKGRGIVSGINVRLSAWRRVSASGTEYLSGAIEEVIVGSDMPQPDKPKEEPKVVEDEADSIPF